MVKRTVINIEVSKTWSLKCSSRHKYLSPGARVCGCGVITGPDGIAADFLGRYQFSLLYVVRCSEYITWKHELHELISCVKVSGKF